MLTARRSNRNAEARKLVKEAVIKRAQTRAIRRDSTDTSGEAALEKSEETTEDGKSDPELLMSDSKDNMTATFSMTKFVSAQSKKGQKEKKLGTHVRSDKQGKEELREKMTMEFARHFIYQRDKSSSRLRKIVNHRYFDLGTTFFIIFNAVMV